MICSIDTSKNMKVFQALEKLVGRSSRIINTYVATILNPDTETYTAEFKDYLTKQKVNIDILTEDEEESAKLAKHIKDFCELKKIKPNLISDLDKANIFGYGSVKDREEGIRHFSDIILDVFRSYDERGEIPTKNAIDTYIGDAKREWIRIIFQRIADKRLVNKQANASAEEVEEEYKKDIMPKAPVERAEWFKKQLGDSFTIEDQNVIAVYLEYINDIYTGSEFMVRAMASPKLQFISGAGTIDADTQVVMMAANMNKADNGVDSDGNVTVDEDTLDSYFGELNHFGEYSTFTMHLGQRISTYFDSLPILKSPNKADGQYQYDTNNRFGVADRMNAKEVTAMLFSISHSFGTMNSTIKAIREVAAHVKGFECFTKLADDLENDKDFATEFRTVFAKTVISKMQLRVNGAFTTAVKANERSDRYSTMLYNLLANGRSTTMSVDLPYVAELSDNLVTIKEAIEDEKATEKDKADSLEKGISTLNTLLRMYFPSIDENAIRTYIYSSVDSYNVLDPSSNYIALMDMALAVVKDTTSVRESFANLQNKKAKAKRIYHYYKSLEQDGKHVSQKKYEENRKVYSEDFLTDDFIGHCMGLVDALMPYSVVRLQLNSVNVYGNNSSDVINNSYITRIAKLFQNNYRDASNRLRNEALERWGKKKLGNGTQYKYSSILLEQKDDNGNIISYGIFREYTDGTLEITEQAEHLLKVYLFDGSSFFDKGTNCVYKDMGEGAYMPTAYMAYHNTTRVYAKSITEDRKLLTANYFCRTPSDAPKNFVIRGVRYSTQGLFELADKDYVEKTTKDILKDVNTFASEYTSKPFVESINENLKGTAQYDNSNDLINDVGNIIRGKEGKVIWLRTDNHVRVSDDILNSEGKLDVDKTGTKAVARVNIIINGVEKAYIFVGDYKVSQKGNPYLASPRLLSALNMTKGAEKGIHKEYQEGLKTYIKDRILTQDITVGGVKYNRAPYKVNTNHQVFKILKLAAKQELLDCAKAIDYYFENENGHVYSKDNGKGVDKVIKVRENKDNTIGFANYHTGKDGKVLSGDVGNYELGGQVFKTNHFTLEETVVDENGNETVKPKNYLGGLISTKPPVEGEGKRGVINLLYGGTEDNYLHTEKDANGKVVDIKLTREQNEALDRELSQFILDYTNQVEDAVMAKKDFIHNTDVSKDAIADFGLNYLIHYFHSDDIFEGSSKFYKSAQDLLKRAKEIQGSGVPYGIADYLGEDEGNVTLTWSYLNSGRISSKENSPTVQEFLTSLGLNVQQKPAFKAITVANSKVKDNEGTVERLKQMLKTAGVPDAKAQEMVEGFKGTKVNDAQSYITFEEWIRRIAARGQLKKHLPLINKIMDESKPITASDLKAFVQIQKNFYYDHHYNEDYDMEAPRQIKNAELVLVPRLIRGTELEAVYNFMKETGIDQINTVETSKAANEEILTIWDNNCELVDLNDVKRRLQEKPQLIQTFNYNYLYTQQEAHQHVDAENKAGIQIMKKIVDNIPEPPAFLNDKNDTRYNPELYKELKDLYDKKMQFIHIFCQNIKSAYDDVVKSLNIKTDENGNIVLNEDGLIDNLNTEVFFDRFREELLRVGCDINLIDYVTLEDGKPRMPLYISMSIRKLESVAQSIFNGSITRQKLPGFHVEQTTAVGWRKLSDKRTGKYAEDLYYHPMTYKKGDKVIDQREFNKLDAEEQKTWVENGPAPYIEVRMPKSNFGIDMNSAHYMNMSDEEILEELKANNLDMVIGYRIPTEGKQSVCMMKVVGFIDDAYGSTLVVPNDWVSQTGSDFDFDSVYGIQADTYKGIDGKITRANWVGDSIVDWYLYVKRESNDKYLKLGVRKDEVGEISEEIAKAFDKKFNKLLEESNELWKNIPKDFQNMLKKSDFKAKKKRTGDKNEDFKTLLNDRLTTLEDAKRRWVDDAVSKGASKKQARAKFDKLATAAHLTEYKQSINTLIRFLETQKANSKNQFDAKVTELVESRRDKIDSTAKKHGLLSYEDFKKAVHDNPEVVATRKQRNTKLFDLMCEILESRHTVEEQLSRSNFEDVIKWRDIIMDQKVKARRGCRSAYNIIDQIAYQEDAMSGAKLKGISVMLDTFNSVCNTVRPTLTTPVTIVYDTKDYITPDNAKNANQIIGRFGTGAEINGNRFYITHNKYGWSNQDGNGDRNVAGALITPYSSETTAHILDAIKEGIVPGVNAYTFATYKTFLNIGSDFNAAISFIMQPGVLRVVQEYEKNNSVFATGYGSPIENSIKALAKQLGLDVSYSTPIATVFNQLNTGPGFKDDLNAMFKVIPGEDLSFSLRSSVTEKIPIIVSLMTDRIKEQGIFDKSNPNAERLKTIFDIATICIFNRMHKIAGEVMDIAGCCNPDKFGAKQSVFATNEVIEHIQDLVKDESKVPVLTVQDKKTGNMVHILEGIYPGIRLATTEDPIKGMRDRDIKDSHYPSLYAFLKYSTCTSIIVNRTLFDTQSTNFVNAIKGITTVFSGYDPELKEEEYNEVQTYLLNYFYKKVPSIEQPIEIGGTKKNPTVVIPTIGSSNSYVPTKTDEENIASAIAANQQGFEERIRIYGFGHSASTNLPYTETTVENVEEEKEGKKQTIQKQVTKTVFKPLKIADINNPTKEELEEFNKFSPAQKVQWIQENFDTENTIFDYLTVQLFNTELQGRLAGAQVISINDTAADENTMILLHRDAIFSENPLVRLAAIDMVKYAIVFENYHLSSTGISKIISNDALRTPVEERGLGFIDFMDITIGGIRRSSFSQFNETTILNNIYEYYLRSHPNSKGVRTIRYNSTNVKRYSLRSLDNDVYNVKCYVKPDATEEEAKDAISEWQDRMVSAGIKYKVPAKDGNPASYEFNNYIRIQREGKVTLYKINRINDNECLLYPLNPLDVNECFEWSANEDNNIQHKSKVFYEELVRQHIYETNELQVVKAFANSESLALRKQEIETKLNKDTNVTSYTKITKSTDLARAKSFNLEKLAESNSANSGGAVDALDKIKKHYSKAAMEQLYIANFALNSYITTEGVKYGSEQEIHIRKNGDPIAVSISLTNYAESINKALQKNKDDKYIMNDTRFEKFVGTLGNSTLADIARSARAMQLTSVPPIFFVSPVQIDKKIKAEAENFESEDAENPEIGDANFESMELSILKDSVDNINSLASHGYEMAISAKQDLVRENIKLVEETVKADRLAVYKNTAAVAESLAQDLDVAFNSFTKSPTDALSRIGILDPVVMDILQSKVVGLEDKEVIERKYVDSINKASAFLNNYSQYKSINKEDKTDDEKYYINKIQDALNKVESLNFEEANRRYAEIYISSLSDNPLVKNQTIKITDNYWKTYGSMWIFHDVAESGNPLVQTVLREVMGNVEADIQFQKREKRKVFAKIREIIEEAKRDGINLSLNDIIDEDGRLIQYFTPEFLEEYNRLYEAREAAIRLHGLGSVEHLKAKLDYDQFKATHINQEAKKEYYIKKCALERGMLAVAPKIYSEYMIKVYERANLLKNAAKTGLTEVEQEQLDDINRAISRLLAESSFYDEAGKLHIKAAYMSKKERKDLESARTARKTGSGTAGRPLKERTVEYEEASSLTLDDDPFEFDTEDMLIDFEDDHEAGIMEHGPVYSIEAGAYLRDFVSKKSSLDDEYFEYKPNEGFEELLQINLKIISDAEDRDANGIPRRNQAELENNEKYQNARRWIHQNAKFELHLVKTSSTRTSAIVKKIEAAKSKLGLTSSGKLKEVAKYLRTHGKRDNLGVLDATSLTDEEIAAVRELQLKDLKLSDSYEGCDAVLLSSAPQDENRYSARWYNLFGQSSSEKNKEYYTIVTAINNILGKYYDEVDKTVHFEYWNRLPGGIDEAINDLKELKKLYKKLETAKSERSGISPYTAEEIKQKRKYIDRTKRSLNLKAFNAQARAALNTRDTEGEKGKAYYDAWFALNIRTGEDGAPIMITDPGTDKAYMAPSDELYRAYMPTEEALNNPTLYFVDEKLNEASETMDTYFRKVPTVYWYRKCAEMQQRAAEDPSFSYQEWYLKNRYWNARTKKYELLDIWTQSEVKNELFEGDPLAGSWEPRFNQREKKVKDGWTTVRKGTAPVYLRANDKTNKDYKEDGGIQANYIQGSKEGLYDTKAVINKHALKLRDYIQDVLNAAAVNNYSARKRFSQGYMPKRAILTKSLSQRILSETGKTFGFAINKSKENKDFYDEVDYENDRIPPMPMMDQLFNSELGSETFNEPEPRPEDYGTTEAFDSAHEAWEARRKEVNDKNKEVERKIMDRDWLGVLDEFLDRAAKYNSVQENKYRLYWLLDTIKHQRAFMRQHGSYGHLRYKKNRLTGEKEYIKGADEELLKQLSTFTRRLLYDQWKEDEGIYTQMGKHLQGFTSADYMMLNVKGGIANITLGETGIFAEAVAKQYFKPEHWAFGTKTWSTNSISFIRGMYDDTATSKADAVIKHYRVVDYDEITGVDGQLDMEKYSKRMRDIMFSPQSAGEHFMQNSVLFAMLKSHKIISLDNDPRGIGATFMNEEEYIRYREAQELEDILTDEQKADFEKFKEQQLTDPDDIKDYAWYRKDIITEFVYLYLDKKERKPFLDARKKNRDKYIAEFAKEEDMWNQVELGADGYMKFVTGSKLEKLDEIMIHNNKLSAAYYLNGRFSERVRKVNNKIHGVYNKMGQAYIEGKWYGSLVMQYHKHLPIGILKRYRARGYFNETRGTSEKGLTQTLWDVYLNPYSLNNRRVQRDIYLKNHPENAKNIETLKNKYLWTDDEVNTVQALFFHLRHTMDYLMQVRETWQYISPDERANIYRNLGDAVGTVAGIATAIGAMAVFHDDDDDSITKALLLYEGDRLASEAFMYNPLGAGTEIKTLFSTPVAAQSIINDGINTIKNILGYIFGDEETSQYYKTGRFAGRNKLGVYFERRLPIWNGIRGILDMPHNNHYYKRGKKVISFVPTKKIADWIHDDLFGAK